MNSIDQTGILKGHKLSLEPLNSSHFQELYDIANDESIWIYTPAKAYGHAFHSWFDKAIAHFAKGRQLPFAVRRLSDNKLVGSTRYYDIDSDHARLSIGYTWYAKEVWGSFVNTECKFLLLTHAFEILNMNRVAFAIDSRHERSRAAIKKIGAIEEGILRQHMILDNGYIRDSVVYSIIQPEWKTIKLNLKSRLEEEYKSL